MRTPYYESTMHKQIREKRENRKARIDWMAAALILQSYLDAHREELTSQSAGSLD